ncbi:hypothetical protein Y886_22395 [Xanthomonas hyacinthi DSM 19077]|nr:hypothetical protein Y886_22395 [Xanthomonas hyacinthi DSM 19077]
MSFDVFSAHGDVVGGAGFAATFVDGGHAVQDLGGCHVAALGGVVGLLGKGAVVDADAVPGLRQGGVGMAGPLLPPGLQ